MTKNHHKLWRDDIPSPLGPLTPEMLEKAWAKIQENISRHAEMPVRYVSVARYQAAQRAIDAGATPREVELILMGASPELARELAGASADRD